MVHKIASTLKLLQSFEGKVKQLEIAFKYFHIFSAYCYCRKRQTLHYIKMSDLESCLGTIIEVFHKYSSKEGDKYKLKKSELKDLLTNEFPTLTEHVKDQATMDSLMESVDTDGDSECDFQEFMTFITMVTICCHEFFEHHEDE
uniref:Protein S100-B-like n=3 Tax=Cyprinus carpio TaxID=7962 RepID=A0A8C1H360_CYPCA